MEAVAAAVVAAVLTVVGTEWLVRARDRRRGIEEATFELQINIPRVAAMIWDGWQGERPDTGVFSEWSRHRETCIWRLGQVRVLAKWPTRRAKKIRLQASDLSARMAAADFNWMQSRIPIKGEDILEFNTANLWVQVFGSQGGEDDAIDFYQKNGYATPFERDKKPEK